MLKIKAAGVYLQLPDDIQINFVIENPLMLTDRIPIPYSLSFELPSTPVNLKALKYPNRITSKNGFGEYECEIIFGLITIMPGYLVVTQWDGTIKVSFRGVRFEDRIKKKLYEIDMERYDFGRGHIKFPEFGVAGSMGTIYKNAMTESLQGEGDYVSAPVRTNVDLAELDKYGGWRMGNFTYLNFYNARNNNYMFNINHSPIYPMPFLHKIIDNIFGDLLTDNPFKLGELSKLIMVTYYPSCTVDMLLDTVFPAIAPRTDSLGRPRRVNASDLTDAEKADAYFKLNSFLPGMTANEFLKNLLKLFCATLYPIAGKYKIVQNTEIINSNIVESWTNRLVGKAANSKNVTQTYVYGYESISNDDLGTGPTPIDSISDLLAETTLSDTEGGHDFLITTTGQIYNKYIEDGVAIYTLLNAGLGGKTSDDADTFDITSAVEALPMNIHKYWWEWRGNLADELPKEDWYVPQLDETINVPFSSRPMRGVDSKNPVNVTRGEKVFIMFWRGMLDTFKAPDKYPCITPYNYDHFGNRLGNISLSWDGQDGLINNFHLPFKNWIEMDKLRCRGSFLLTPLDIKNLDLMKKKHINGRLFFIEKLNLTIKKNSISPALADLIEAPQGIRTPFTAERSQSFKKVCAYNQYGSAHTYTKTYSSFISQLHADQLASYDPLFDAEGQQYANDNGTCTLGIRVTATVTPTISILIKFWKITAVLSQPAAVNTVVFVEWYDNLGVRETFYVVIPAGSSSFTTAKGRSSSQTSANNIKVYATNPTTSNGLTYFW